MTCEKMQSDSLFSLGRDIEVIPSVLPSSLHRNTKSVSTIHIDSMDWGNE